MERRSSAEEMQEDCWDDYRDIEGRESLEHFLEQLSNNPRHSSRLPCNPGVRFLPMFRDRIPGNTYPLPPRHGLR